MKKVPNTLVFVSAAFMALSACKQGPNATKLQYMPDMADGPTAKAQESYIDPPADSVPVNAILYPKTYEQAEAELKNPFGEDLSAIKPDMKTRGKHLYDTYCAVCHGFDGKGKGTLGDAYPIPIPDITRPELAAKKDGWFFLRISQGGQQMPAYAYATSPYERWWIITHIRGLQDGSALKDNSGVHVNPSLPQLRQ